MSPRHWPERVKDILEAIAEARAFLGTMTYDEFSRDPKTQKAVFMNIAIIGEAAVHIPDDIRRQHSEVPWHMITAMRNVIVHTYFRVDPKIVWDTATRDLPELEQRLRPLQE